MPSAELYIIWKGFPSLILVLTKVNYLTLKHRNTGYLEPSISNWFLLNITDYKLEQTQLFEFENYSSGIKQV